MKRLVAGLISAGFLALLLWQVDTASLWQNLQSTQWGVFAAAVALFIPQTLTIAWRWKRLVAPFTPLPLAESTRMVLAGASMNLVLPGKLGDMTKGLFLAKAGAISTPLGLGVVAFEKMLDVAVLAVFMLAGVVSVLLQNKNFTLSLGSSLLALGLGFVAVCAVLMLYFIPMTRIPGMGFVGRKAASDKRFEKIDKLLVSSHRTMDALRARGSKRGEILLLSATIWILHLAQIYLFFRCLGSVPPLGEYFAMVPLAIFIGLVPISIAGFGTRDAALVALLPSLPSSTVLAAALYINLRYLLPAIAGIPYVARYALLKKGQR